MSALGLPTGWRVEMLGLAEMVQFTNGSRTLDWCDGVWNMGSRGIRMTARGVPAARTMKEARTVGTAWLAAVEADD